MFNSEDHPHLRLNRLTNEWVIVSPHRMKRPWAGQVEGLEEENIPRHDVTNPLCPRAVRSSGKVSLLYHHVSFISLKHFLCVSFFHNETYMLSR